MSLLQLSIRSLHKTTTVTTFVVIATVLVDIVLLATITNYSDYDPREGSEADEEEEGRSDFFTDDWSRDIVTDSTTGGTADYSFYRGGFEPPYWLVGTPLPCPEVGECTYLINGSDPWGDGDGGGGSSVNGRARDVNSQQVASKNQPAAEADSVEKEDEDDIAAAASRQQETESEPCILTGRLDTEQTWYGYLGVFELRAHGSRLFYHLVYPERRCCPVKLLLYIEEQIKTFNYYMTCVQRASVINPSSPQVIHLSASQSQPSGCVNRTANAAERDWEHRRGDKGRGRPAMLGTIECRGGRALRSNVVRKWFIAASSCGARRGFVLEYTLIVYGHIGKCPSSRDASSASRRLSSFASAQNFLKAALIFYIVRNFW